jgi:steroid 5-alpha reductase family enzyme
VADASSVLTAAAVAIAALMLATWAISLVRRDVSIVDVAWPLGFVLATWAARWVVGAGGAGNWTLLALVTIWGLRLSLHLLRRNLAQGEDFRYRAMRERHGDAFAARSLVTVFALQGVLLFVVALPVTLGHRDTAAGLSTWLVLGVLVWGAGLWWEAVADAQLAAFRRDPRNSGGVLDTGLWQYTRHPNYFGDALVWWGLAIAGASQGAGIWAFVSAAIMTVLLVRVSGAAMLDRLLAERKPGYREYMNRTSGFIPLPSRRGARTRTARRPAARAAGAPTDPARTEPRRRPMPQRPQRRE